MIKKLLSFAIVLPLSSSCTVDTIQSEYKVETPVVVEKKSWKCPDCSPEEQYVLEQLQEHTKITDRNALNTIMGNIKQEKPIHSQHMGRGQSFLQGLSSRWLWSYSVDLNKPL